MHFDSKNGRQMALIDGLQSIPGDSKYKDIAAMLVPSTIEANKHSFVKVPPTWPPWRHMQTKNSYDQNVQH